MVEEPPAMTASQRQQQRRRPSRFDAYEQTVRDSDAAVTKAENDLTVLKNLAQVYQSFAAKGGSELCCPLCTRGFENAAKTEEFTQPC